MDFKYLLYKIIEKLKKLKVNMVFWKQVQLQFCYSEAFYGGHHHHRHRPGGFRKEVIQQWGTNTLARTVKETYNFMSKSSPESSDHHQSIAGISS